MYLMFYYKFDLNLKIFVNIIIKIDIIHILIRYIFFMGYYNIYVIFKYEWI